MITNMVPWIIIVIINGALGDHSFMSERGFATHRECNDAIIDMALRQPQRTAVRMFCIDRTKAS